MLIKRVAALFALLLGLVGVVACLAGIYGVWVLASRLQQANDRVFAAVDKGLVFSQDRVRDVRKRVEEVKITTAEVDRKLRDWGAKEVKERIVNQLEIEARAEKLQGRLEAADAYLDTSTDAIQAIQQAMQLGSSLGAPVDPASVDELLEKLHSVRGSIQETNKIVNDIRAFAAAKEDDPSRLARVVKLVGRALVTISEADSRLDEMVTRLGSMRTDAKASQQDISRYITKVAIACSLILVWIAAGQVALCVCGWRACCRRRAAG